GIMGGFGGLRVSGGHGRGGGPVAPPVPGTYLYSRTLTVLSRSSHRWTSTGAPANTFLDITTAHSRKASIARWSSTASGFTTARNSYRSPTLFNWNVAFTPSRLVGPSSSLSRKSASLRASSSVTALV